MEQKVTVVSGANVSSTIRYSCDTLKSIPKVENALPDSILVVDMEKDTLLSSEATINAIKSLCPIKRSYETVTKETETSLKDDRCVSPEKQLKKKVEAPAIITSREKKQDELPDDSLPPSEKKEVVNIENQYDATVTDVNPDSQDDSSVGAAQQEDHEDSDAPVVDPDCLEKDPRLLHILGDILPTEYQHLVTDVESCSAVHNVTPSIDPAGNFKATIRINLRSEEEALEWLEHFKASSFLDFAVDDSYKNCTQKVIFKKGYTCYPNTGPSPHSNSHHKRHINCPGYLMLTVRNFNMKRSADPYLQSHPAKIHLHYCHNHSIRITDAIRNHRSPPALEEIFNNLYARGHSPSSALQVHKYNLQWEHPDDYLLYWADRSHCPNLQWCYNQFHKSYHKPYSRCTGDELCEALESIVNNYNNMGSICAKLHKEDDEIILALCTPFMKRVHSLKCSGEVAFVDIAGQLELEELQILLMVTYSVCGDLPLGLIIFNREGEEVLQKGLNLLREILPEKAFYGRGVLGPVTLLIDNQPVLRNSLSKVFRCADIQLCKFHALQAFWDFIWEDDNGLKEVEDRRKLFQMFNDMVNQKTEEKFEDVYQHSLHDITQNKHWEVLMHIQDLGSRAGEWAMCYRSGNYMETKFHTLKDVVMKMCKSFTFVQYFDFFVTHFHACFESRISDILNKGLTDYTRSRYSSTPNVMGSFEYELSEKYPYQYNVINKEDNKSYVVDMELETCSCHQAQGGAICKHLSAVVQKFNPPPLLILPHCTPEIKKQLHFLLMGHVDTIPGVEFVGAEEKENSSLRCDDVDEKDTVVEEDPISRENEPALVKIEQERRDRCREELNEVFQHLESCLVSAPEAFTPAIEKFCEAFFQTVSEQSQNCLASALQSFNTDSFISEAPSMMLSQKQI